MKWWCRYGGEGSGDSVMNVTLAVSGVLVMDGQTWKILNSLVLNILHFSRIHHSHQDIIPAP